MERGNFVRKYFLVQAKLSPETLPFPSRRGCWHFYPEQKLGALTGPLSGMCSLHLEGLPDWNKTDLNVKQLLEAQIGLQLGHKCTSLQCLVKEACPRDQG